ncbi:hypothetical protein M3Y97_01168200 [Aphelenchoides bicaudatus]|nr:hypothetical protein M3Y97_01168200 [Aphelenchoides bicaudatus]
MEAKVLVILALCSFANSVPLNKEYNREDVPCLNFVAVFDGTFQSPQNDQHTFDAQFQLRINKNHEHFLFNFEYWNQTLLPNNKIMIELATEPLWHNWQSCVAGQPCPIPADLNSKYVAFSLFHTYPVYAFRLFQLNINTDNGYGSTLPNAYNGCTNVLPPLTTLANNQPDPSFFKFCMCCGVYEPDAKLNCPSSFTNSHTTCPSKG